MLRAPRCNADWTAYHAIRRRVLFENRGLFGVYDENHPDDRALAHHPLLLLYQDEPTGVIRIDVKDQIAWFRRVAVREDWQRRGHGKVLLQLAEIFARAAGCDVVRSNVAVDAVGFYERCGFLRDLSQPVNTDSMPMMKLLGKLPGFVARPA
jgi:GNAT superfamily N-acetyltransferase